MRTAYTSQPIVIGYKPIFKAHFCHSEDRSDEGSHFQAYVSLRLFASPWKNDRDVFSWAGCEA